MNRAWTTNAGTQPAIAMASDTLSPAAVARFAQFVEPGVGHAAAGEPGAGAQQRPWRDAHRRALRIGAGQLVGDVTRVLPTGPCRGEVAVGQPGAGAHVPVNAACRSPAALRCSAIRAAFSSADSGARCSMAAASLRCSSARSALSWDS